MQCDRRLNLFLHSLMSWNSLTPLPPTPPTLPSIQMNVESQSSHNIGPGFPPSHLPSQAHVDETQHDVYHHPRNLSFLGPLPPSHEQSIQDFNTWNRSPRGLFPSQPLQVPGQPSPLSPPPPDHPPPPISWKCKRTAPTDPATVGGYGPIPGSPDGQTDRLTPDPVPAIKFTEQKNSAYNVWPFIRGVETDDTVPAEQWQDDYSNHLTSRPNTMHIGCKFCTQFR